MKNFKILSGSALKVIAIISMFCDHTAKDILAAYDFAWQNWFTVGGLDINLMYVMTGILGRIAFPLFAFLVVEGYLHTHDFRKYALNLLIFAIISVIPWQLLHGGLGTFEDSNVLFTLFLGVTVIFAIDQIRGWKGFAFLVISLLLAWFCRVDYDIRGILTIILIFAMRNSREFQSLGFIGCLFRDKATAGVPLAAIPVLMYNGERGFIKGKAGKYIFYSIYPLHLLLIYGIRIWLGIA